MEHIDHLMFLMDDAFDPAFGEAWTRRQIEDALLIGNCHYLLIAPDGEVIMPSAAIPHDHAEIAGFALSRQGYDEEELLLFAVRPKYRRRGLGRRLLDAMFSQARRHGSKRMLLEMREGNPAGLLYVSCGFEAIGQRRDYYRTPDGNRLNGITFALELAPDF